ncbi:MAG TPA: TonB-dependent receptor, partial [Myxococcaceae bacterium]|nr:TonB-dependent receptor [Myxococcaceae bacterium]
ESYQPYDRPDIELRAETTLRVSVELLPENAGYETVVVTGRPPTVDVGSTATGAQVSSQFIQSIPLVQGQRSFDQVALVAPGVQTDFRGIAIAGATSPENQFLVDGLTTNDVVFGVNAAPVNVEFVDQVNVITGGFMPEYGRATGGTISATTKSGGNEFHGSVWGTWTPGAIQGGTPTIIVNGATFSALSELYNRWDVGGTLGGYIIKDRLWFFAGFAAEQTKDSVTRTTNYLDSSQTAYTPCPDGQYGCQPAGAGFGTGQRNFINAPGSPYPGYVLVRPLVDPTTGFVVSHPIPGTALRQFDTTTGYQYIAKLTFLLNPDQRFSLEVFGAPVQEKTAPRVSSNFTESQAFLIPSSFVDVVGKWSGSFLEKRLLIDVTAGWQYQANGQLPTDGSAIGSSTGLASQARAGAVNYHNLTEFAAQFERPVPPQCAPITYPAPAGAQPQVFYPCPTNGSQAFGFGGPGSLNEGSIGDTQAKAVVTYLARWIGSHVLKAGVDIAYQTYSRLVGWSGGIRPIESSSGEALYYTDLPGVLTAPDNPVVAPTLSSFSNTISVGAFVQDSWSILNVVTLNFGVRFDSQSMYGADGQLGLTVPSQWSPRIGVIWDPTQKGRAKVFANFGTYYENIPLDIADRELPGYPFLFAERGYGASTPPGVRCNPILDPAFKTTCSNPANALPLGLLSANRSWAVEAGDKAAVDPNLSGQSSSEVVVGGEYEILANGRLGATYTRRWMNRVIEDMSNDEGATYFVGNPGYGVADNFPKAVRNYTAVTVSFTKNFSNLWQAQLSYTYQSLVGNYQGLILSGPPGGQTDPNLTAAFDLRSMLPNTSGRLPGDITNTLKGFGSYEWVVLPVFSVTFGGAVTGRSGPPYSYLGANIYYGPGMAYILTRGNAGTLPWVWSLDGKLGLNFRASSDVTLTFAVDCFNILNSAQVTDIDQNYTFAPVLPIIDGTAQGLKGTPSALRYADHSPYSHVDDNLNFGRPTAYQTPRSWRFAARVSF